MAKRCIPKLHTSENTLCFIEFVLIPKTAISTIIFFFPVSRTNHFDKTKYNSQREGGYRCQNINLEKLFGD